VNSIDDSSYINASHIKSALRENAFNPKEEEPFGFMIAT
jgi:hypothetical protein